MTDLVWPNGVRQSSVTWRNVDNTEVYNAPLSGGIQTVARPGNRLACTVTVRNSTGAERRKLRALAAALRGKANRIYVPDFAFQRAGSFSATELLANADFSNGATGWSPGSDAAVSASDGVMRVKRIANITPGAAFAGQTVPIPDVYGAYCWRIFNSAVRGAASLRATSGAFAGSELDSGSTGIGYKRTSAMPSGSATIAVYCDNTGASISSAGDYFDVAFASFARCLLVDGGGNLLLRSDEFDTASWPKSRVTVGAGSAVAPDGTVTGESLAEDGTAANTHYVVQSVAVSSAVADFEFTVSVKAGTRSWVCVSMSENVGNTDARVFVNLATGAIGTINVSSGTNWVSLRGFSVSQGNGWYRISIVARKASAATLVQPLIVIAEADNDITFSGLSANSLYIWRATLTQNSVPGRQIQTTSAAVAASVQSGYGIYVKGGPASVSGALKVGDAFEIDKQLKFCTAPLDFDAAGCGYLQFEPALPRAVADNVPIIIEKPMCKMYMTNEPEYESVPGQISDFSFEFMQDLSA